MRKSFLIYEEMRKYLVIYEEAVGHIWFPYILCEEIFFLSVQNGMTFAASIKVQIMLPLPHMSCMVKLVIGQDAGQAQSSRSWILCTGEFLIYFDISVYKQDKVSRYHILYLNSASSFFDVFFER